MKIVVLLARFLFAIPILAFGLFGLLVVMRDPEGFLDQNEGMSEAGKDCLLAMWESKFLMPSICVIHAACGLFVLVNRYTPLALLVHLPVSIQMVLFHLFLDPATGLLAYPLAAMNIALMIHYREVYQPLLRAKPLQRVRP